MKKRKKVKYKEDYGKLNLPVIRVPMPGPPILSMDQYLEFVTFYRQHIVNLEAYEKRQKEARVDVPFRL